MERSVNRLQLDEFLRICGDFLFLFSFFNFELASSFLCIFYTWTNDIFGYVSSDIGYTAMNGLWKLLILTNLTGITLFMSFGKIIFMDKASGVYYVIR